MRNKNKVKCIHQKIIYPRIWNPGEKAETWSCWPERRLRGDSRGRACSLPEPQWRHTECECEDLNTEAVKTSFWFSLSLGTEARQKLWVRNLSSRSQIRLSHCLVSLPSTENKTKNPKLYHRVSILGLKIDKIL